MATKLKPKAAGKKIDKKSKPVAKNKAPLKSVKKVAKTVKKAAPIKSSPKVAMKNKVTSTKSKLTKPAAKVVKPVKASIKPALKTQVTPKIAVQAVLFKEEPKAVPKIMENKKLVNKPTINKTVVPPTVTNGKTRYSDVELAEFKKIIDDKLVIARQELNYLQEQIVEMNENNADIQGSDWFDDSSIHAEVELLNNMAIRQRQFIQNLENALVRIENKTYGICTITGTLIDKKRLLLVPHATKSIEAKHIEQATMVPELNQVAPDERVLRRSAEGKGPKKPVNKKAKSKSSKEYDDDEGDDMIEAPIEELDGAFEGGDD